ncbi:M56 family metallopeptidase [Acididesulfobacillus acetoxydans]
MAQTMGRPVDAGQMALSALLVWLAGAMLFGLYVIFVNGRLFLRVEKTAREPQEFERELLERSKRILNLKADIRLRISPLVRMPVLFGFLRPTLLLPAGLPDQINPHELKHIFLHELVHYRQRDFLVNGLMVFLKGIYWFDPLVWYAFYLMRQDIEMACDARVLSHLDPTERSHYGYTMIHLLQIAKPQGFPGGMGILGKPSRMKRRIIMISSFKKGSAMRVALGVALLMVLGVILLTRAPNSSAESLHTSQAQGANLKSAGADSGSGSGKDGHSALGVNTQNNVVSKQVPAAPNNGIRIQSIQGQTFKGEVMLIKDPKRVKAVMTNQPGVAGERITSFVKQTGALAGINAGGFNDPNGKGNGSFPEGLTVHDGKLVYNSAGKAVVHQVIGIDSQGKLIIAPMSADELVAKHIQEAVTFYGPTLIKNGTPVIEGDGGIGIAPRTGIGQTADGTIIFVVIDGRQPTWSWGATGRDLMNVFLEYHAINAVNLDGGSSTEMVYQGKVINHLWDIFGERRVPTAFVVMPQAGKAS